MEVETDSSLVLVMMDSALHALLLLLVLSCTHFGNRVLLELEAEKVGDSEEKGFFLL